VNGPPDQELIIEAGGGMIRVPIYPLTTIAGRVPGLGVSIIGPPAFVLETLAAALRRETEARDRG
jgi:hypothetical protein